MPAARSTAAERFEFAPGLVAAARGALVRGAPILCDAEMVAHGVTRARLPAKNEVICTLRDPRVPELAATLGTTRSAAALELWRDRLDGAVVAIGNAPTALFRLLRCWPPARRGRPRFIGMPVGFVGAAESKEALAANLRRALSHRARADGRQRDGGGGGQCAGEGRAMSARLLSASASAPAIPELLTLKAVRALQAADVVAHFAKAGRRQCARASSRASARPASSSCRCSIR